MYCHIMLDTWQNCWMCDSSKTLRPEWNVRCVSMSPQLKRRKGYVGLYSCYIYSHVVNDIYNFVVRRFRVFLGFSAGFSPFRFCSALLFSLENRIFSHVIIFLFPSLFLGCSLQFSIYSISLSSVAFFFHFPCLLSSRLSASCLFNSPRLSIFFQVIAFWTGLWLLSIPVFVQQIIITMGRTHYPPGRRGCITARASSCLSPWHFYLAMRSSVPRRIVHSTCTAHPNKLARITHGKDARKLDFA